MTEGVRQVCASQYRMHIKKVQCTKCSEALCNKCSLEVDKNGAAYQVALACAPVCGAALLSGARRAVPRRTRRGRGWLAVPCLPPSGALHCRSRLKPTAVAKP